MERFQSRNLNKDKKFLFIHIPKTGGTSIERFLFNNRRSADHNSLNLHKEKNKDINFDEYYKFVAVRNPYLRAISGYTFIHNMMLRRRFKKGDKGLNPNTLTLELFFENDEIGTILKIKQLDFINDIKEMDYVMHTETLNDDMKHIANKYDLDINEFSKSNISNYRHFLKITPRFIEIINEKYAEEFELFGYKKINKIDHVMKYEEFKSTFDFKPINNSL